MIIGSIKFTLDIVDRVEANIVSSHMWRKKSLFITDFLNSYDYNCGRNLK